MHGIHYYIVNIPDIEIYFKVILKIKHWTCIILFITNKTNYAIDILAQAS